MLLAHKIALNPNASQRQYFSRAAGTARFAYNWALAEWKRQYSEGGKPSEVALRKQLNSIKREQFPWMFDVTKCAVQEAIIDLGAAFRSFFEKRGSFPKFKNRDSKPSFCAANAAGSFKADGKRIRLPVVGWVRMRETVRFSGPLKRATVSFEGGRWFVALSIETEDVHPLNGLEGTVGVDLGVKTLATLSTGEAIDGPKAHRKALKKLRRAQRILSRRKKGSANRRKAKAKVARIHARVAAIRRDSLHKLTSKLAKTYAVIGIEDLNVKGMVKNRCLARSISDIGFFEFRRQLHYKARLYSSRVVVVDRWFPSSKACSACGVVKAALDLSERTFECDECGLVIDRDLNAAMNLRNVAASSAVSACGVERSGTKRKSRVKRSTVKQEENTALDDAA
jgi:putative transposase